MTGEHPIHLVFMLEEESMEHFLQTLLPKILPSGVDFKCIPHEGKSDLQKSIPNKLKAWLTPNTFFIILHDQDSHDCRILKSELQQICSRQDQHSPLIRIICRELEAWYFGDLDAVQSAFPGFNATRYKNRSRFRNPDDIVCPSKELQAIVNGFGKVIAAKTIPQYMDITTNTSTSFNNTISGIMNLVETKISERGD